MPTILRLPNSYAKTSTLTVNNNTNSLKSSDCIEMAFNTYSVTSSHTRLPSSIQDLTNTFVLSSTPSSKQILFEIPKVLNVDPSRQRRVHQKSKKGCDNCRKRRVKCDEEFPCENCKRRGDKCRYLVQSLKAEATPAAVPSLARNLLPSSMTSEVVNLQHMKLFHHFQTATRQTLLFSPKVWEHALQLSFKFECLMNAILCIAARHLAYLRPQDAVYPAAAASHLGRALSRFRLELSNDLTSFHLDVFVATSVLLQFELWINTDFLPPQSGDRVPLDMSRDCIFTFSTSLKQVFLKNFPRAAVLASEFMPCIRDNPMDRLVDAAQISDDTLAVYHDFFSYRRPITLDMIRSPPSYTRNGSQASSQLWDQHGPRKSEEPNEIEDDYRPVVTRLCLILSFLPEAEPPAPIDVESPLLPTLARYCLLFPIMCFGPFASMVHKSDPHALLLLYHFYRAVRSLLASGEFWWAQQRATMLESRLKKWLSTECAKENANGTGLTVSSMRP